MPKRVKPPRSWDLDDLLDLGKKEGEKAKYLKAIPVLILEKWVLEGREEGVSNYFYTNHLARRLENCGLVPPFKSKGTSNIIAALSSIQNSRNLTRPHLIDFQGQGLSCINLPHYESLLQEYRKKYYEDYPEDYKKLFPEGEPEWEQTGLPKARSKYREAEPVLEGTEVRDELQSIIAPVEVAFREQQQMIERLTKENQNLHERLEAKRNDSSMVSFVHTSPDFHHSVYGGKITSIKDTIQDMLNRANHAVRISTRQMDMFSDELISLKRRNPQIDITVLSRGPEGAAGDRRKLAGRKFELMMQAGINLPVERDTLHSRMVVIDANEVLISSADLDYTQMELEFNAGIWTNNPDIVAEAIRYFDNLLVM